jgi:hypothetical protein
LFISRDGNCSGKCIFCLIFIIFHVVFILLSHFFCKSTIMLFLGHFYDFIQEFKYLT